MDRLFRELRRRNIFRVAGIYAVVGWLLVQVAVALEAAMQMPAWFDAMVTSLLLIGFPVAMIFAWAFEMTPDGVKRTHTVEPGESIAHETGRKLDYALLAGLVIVAMIVLGDRFIPRLDDNSPSAEVQEKKKQLARANPNEKSIAVLPFADLSPEGNQEYFADGLSEEILNVLAQIDELQVAGRTSSFAFKGDNRNLREIGELLNVAHILEGSVRKSGNQIRVTAQLINTSDGYHVFSETYEGDLSDIFRVQDDISRQITAALRTEWLGEEMVAESEPEDVAAFDLYLQARQLIYTRDRERMEQADLLLDRALEIDPAYAPALAQKSIVNQLLSDGLGNYGDRPQLEAVRVSLALAERAIAIDPALGEAWAAKGLALDNGSGEPAEILQAYRRAVELNPGLSDAKNWMASLLVSLSQIDEATAVYESVVEVDPFYAPAFSNLVSQYTFYGEFDKADALIARMERVSGETEETLQARGFIAQSKGEVATAISLFERAMNFDANSTVLRANYVSELVSIGAWEEALESAVDYQRPIILEAMGRPEEAHALILAMPPPAEAGIHLLAMSLFTFGLGDHDDEAIAYFERHFGSLQEAVDLGPYDAAVWLPFLASAYQDTGETDSARTATDLFDESLEVDRRDGLENFDIFLAESMLATLRGQDDEAVAYLEKALDAGLVDEIALRPALFDPIRHRQDFQAIEAENARRINEERAKLDLPPLPAM